MVIRMKWRSVEAWAPNARQSQTRTSAGARRGKKRGMNMAPRCSRGRTVAQGEPSRTARPRLDYVSLLPFLPALSPALSEGEGREKGEVYGGRGNTCVRNDDCSSDW